MLLPALIEMNDHRRTQGRRYKLPHILLFAVLAIASNANSYRTIHTWIVEHYHVLDELFDLHWKRMPAYTTIRDIIQQSDGDALERVLRTYGKAVTKNDRRKRVLVALDGKVLRGSFDRFHDQGAIQVLSAFLTDEKIILAHEEIEEKTNEIPVAQQLLPALGLQDALFTLDALHCQKKR